MIAWILNLVVSSHFYNVRVEYSPYSKFILFNWTHVRFIYVQKLLLKFIVETFFINPNFTLFLYFVLVEFLVQFVYKTLPHTQSCKYFWSIVYIIHYAHFMLYFLFLSTVVGVNIFDLIWQCFQKIYCKVDVLGL